MAAGSGCGDGQPRGAGWRSTVPQAVGWWGHCVLLGKEAARRQCHASPPPPARPSPQGHDKPATARTTRARGRARSPPPPPPTSHVPLPAPRRAAPPIRCAAGQTEEGLKRECGAQCLVPRPAPRPFNPPNPACTAWCEPRGLALLRGGAWPGRRRAVCARALPRARSCGAARVTSGKAGARLCHRATSEALPVPSNGRPASLPRPLPAAGARGASFWAVFLPSAPHPFSSRSQPRSRRRGVAPPPGRGAAGPEERAAAAASAVPRGRRRDGTGPPRLPRRRPGIALRCGASSRCGGWRSAAAAAWSPAGRWGSGRAAGRRRGWGGRDPHCVEAARGRTKAWWMWRRRQEEPRRRPAAAWQGTCVRGLVCRPRQRSLLGPGGVGAAKTAEEGWGKKSFFKLNCYLLSFSRSRGFSSS